MATESCEGKLAALPKKRAYATFLAGSGDYVKGVIGLAKGLRRVKSAYPLVVAVLPDVPEEHRLLLLSQGCIVREIDPIYPPKNQVQFANAYYVINYSKMRVFEFEDFSKMVFLDADIQVFSNVDHLFEKPDGRFYAVMDCFCEKSWSYSTQYAIGYCQQCPERVSWPAGIGPPPARYFNSGMFVFEPSRHTSRQIVEALDVIPVTPFAEQDFMNVFFEKIYEPLPLDYNLILAMLWRHPENFDFNQVKIFHYCAAGSKPWRYTGKEENMDREDVKMLVEEWWKIYNDESLDFKSEVAVQETQTLSSRPAIELAGSVVPAAC